MNIRILSTTTSFFWLFVLSQSTRKSILADHHTSRGYYLAYKSMLLDRINNDTTPNPIGGSPPNQDFKPPGSFLHLFHSPMLLTCCQQKHRNINSWKPKTKSNNILFVILIVIILFLPCIVHYTTTNKG